MKKYTLMNKDVAIATFTVKLSDEENVYNRTNYVDDLKIHDKSKYDSIVGEIELIQFLNSRKAPKHRAHIKKLFNYMDFNDITVYLDITYGLSLIDTIWIRPVGFDIDWRSVSLYSNAFSDVVAHYAFSGIGLFGQHFKTTSPEFSTNGALPKCWVRRDGKVYLRKGSTAYFGFSNSGFEPYAEYYASQVAMHMRIMPFVTYDLEKYDGVLSSICPLFTSENVSYISMSRYLAVHGKTIDRSFYKVLDGLGLMEAYNDLMLFDCVICNVDRHLGNFGLLVDADTYIPIGLSPIFDNGMSLAHMWLPDSGEDIVEYANTVGPKLVSASFVEYGKSLMNARRHSYLERLEGWEIPRHPLYNWGDEKFEGMQRLLKYQVKSML